MADFVKLKKEPEAPKEKKKSLFTFRNILLAFLIFFIFSSLLSSITYSLTPKIAVVPIKGVIASERTKYQKQLIH